MNDTTKFLTIGLSTLGVIFFMAMAFGVMPWKYAIFLGVVCFILAGAARRIAAQRD